MPRFSDIVIREAIESRQHVKVYPLPDTGEKHSVGVMLLSGTEVDKIRIEAMEFCKTKKVDLTLDPDFLDRVIHRMTVFRAFVDAEHATIPFFERMEQVEALDELYVRTLYELYIAHQQYMDPLTALASEEVEGFVSQLGKSVNYAVALKLCAPDTLLSCAIFMASILRDQQQTPKSSTTSTH